MPLLTVNNLSTQLKIGKEILTVVEDVSFSIEKGKTLALVGESGSGKTMLALSLLRILPSPPALEPTGEVLYNGLNLLTIPEKKLRRLRGSRLAMIFQDPGSALNPVYKVCDQLAEVVNLHLGLYGEEAWHCMLEAFKEVGIPSPESRLHAYPHQLSGGMKQRVMIAMALICQPDLLIADEPTTALDVTVQAQVLDLMRDLQQARGMGILLITHDMGVVAEMADDIVVMYAARAVESAPTEDLFDQMQHPYTRALFHSRPQVQTPHQRLVSIPGSVPNPNQFPSGCRFHPRCQDAMECCKSGDVPEKTDKKHSVKCWLYDKTASSRS